MIVIFLLTLLELSHFAIRCLTIIWNCIVFYNIICLVSCVSPVFQRLQVNDLENEFSSFPGPEA